ncbi:hypothetical protein ACO2I3_01105 [Leptospira interrogans]
MATPSDDLTIEEMQRYATLKSWAASFDPSTCSDLTDPAQRNAVEFFTLLKTFVLKIETIARFIQLGRNAPTRKDKRAAKKVINMLKPEVQQMADRLEAMAMFQTLQADETSKPN